MDQHQKMKNLFSSDGENKNFGEIKLNENLEILWSEKCGFNIKAKIAFKEGEIAATIPKDACLSVKTCAISDILELEKMAGILGLGIAVMYEMACQEKSPWFDYLSLLPDQEKNCSIFWSESDLSLIVGTDLGRSIDSDKEYLVSDYTDHVAPLLEKYPDLFSFPAHCFSLEKWIKTCTFISSRAFHVDDFHGEAIVPFADLFNHKTDGEHVHFQGDEACPFCGTSGGCGCQEEEEWQDTEETDDEIPTAIPIDSSPSTTSTDVLELVFVKTCEPGSQVYNTYGNHCSTTLARMYGFVDPHGVNPYSTLRIDREEMWTCMGRGGSYKKWYEVVVRDGERDSMALRVLFWNKVGAEVCGQLEEDESYEDDDGDDDVMDGNHDHESCEESVHEHADSDADTEIEEGCGSGCTRDHHDIDKDIDMEGDEFNDQEDQDEEIFDDFCLEATSKPSFQLYCFLHFLLMPESLFEKVAGDLDSCVQFVVTLKEELLDDSWIPAPRATTGKNKGKGKASTIEVESQDVILSRKVIETIQKAVRLRLEGYPDLPDLAELAKTSERAHIAKVLRDEELTILNTFMQKTAHLQMQE